MSLEKHTQCSENLITFPQIAMRQTLETLNILLVIRVYYKIVCGLPQVALEVNNPPAFAGDIRDAAGLIPRLGSPGGGHAIHSSVLAWRIPRTEEPGGLQSIGSHGVGHD